MRNIKIALINTNSTIGAFKSNTENMLKFARQAAEEECAVAVFPEQSIAGYPAEDLSLWNDFVQGQWRQLQHFIEMSGKFDFPTVYILGVTVADGGHLYNCAAVVCKGKILGLVPKEKLPTYEIFYEARIFSVGTPGFVGEINGVPFGDLIFKFPFGTIATEVCEDLWSPDGPMNRRAYAGAELIVNISASPFRLGVLQTRREIISTRAADNLCTIIYVNQYGGNDSLVFDGGGFVNQCGQMVMGAKRWCEGMTTVVVDLDQVISRRRGNTTWRTDCQQNHQNVGIIKFSDFPFVESDFISPVKIGNAVSETQADLDGYFEDLLRAMKTGLAGYFEKTGAFKRIGISLSGGKDSVLTLIVAWLYAMERFSNLGEEERKRAIKNFIHCFSQPTRFNSQATRDIARIICEELGVSFLEIPLDDTFDREVEATKAMLGQAELTRLTLQNIQVRLRAKRMWNWSNGSDGLFLQTGNMSEKAVGYTTVGGDLMGAYSLICNLPKTVVIALIHYLYGKYKWEALKLLLETKASAELEPDQEDERDLMPFKILDACFEMFAGQKMMPVDIYKTLRAGYDDERLRELCPSYHDGMLKEWVKKFTLLFIRSIYKWVQSPQGVHLGSLDLDRERALQLPTVQSLEWLGLEELDLL